MHRRIVNPVLENLDKERAGYFIDVVQRIEADPRTQRFPNYVFQLLKDTIPLLPAYLDKKELVEMVFAFVTAHQGAMKRRMYSADFARHPEILNAVTGPFVTAVVERTLQAHDAGEIDTGELSHKKFTWPYRAEDLVDPDDEDAVAALKERPTYTGQERRKRRD